VFSQARWRLTLWFAGVTALILAVVGGAIFLSARTALFDQVNDDLEARAGREAGGLAARLIARPRDPQDVPVGPAFTAGGYFYALVSPEGAVLGQTANVDPDGLAGDDAIASAIEDGPTFADTQSSDGEDLRVYVRPIQGPSGRVFLLEVGRSTEPERQALRRLLFILGGGGGAGVLLALGGGFFLAGRALAPIQTAMGRQRAFVADASHELRTPLALIRANAELLKRHADQPPSENPASVDDIIGETDRLSHIVGQMLTLAQADAGQTPFQHEDVDLSEIAADTAREMRLLAGPKNISIEAQTAGPIHVTGDTTRLRELATILIDNAIKYSDPGAAVRVSVRAADGKARLQVTDSGRGIPPEALPHLFDRFYRADKARSREMGGSGLGLAIAKWIAEAHGGSIRVESAPGTGATVTVELPSRG